MSLKPALLVRICLCCAALCGHTGEAAAVYRCETLGRTAYQQHPCNEGREVAVADDRTEAQRREMADITSRQAVVAKSLARDRAAELKQSPASGPILLGHRETLGASPAAQLPRKRQVIRSKAALANKKTAKKSAEEQSAPTPVEPDKGR